MFQASPQTGGNQLEIAPGTSLGKRDECAYDFERSLGGTAVIFNLVNGASKPLGDFCRGVQTVVAQTGDVIGSWGESKILMVKDGEGGTGLERDEIASHEVSMAGHRSRRVESLTEKI